MTETAAEQIAKIMKSLATAQLMKPIITAAVAVGEQIKDRLDKSPGPSNSPVKWVSVKQRKAYFAKRHAANLPPKYKRVSDPMSEKMEQAWVVEKLPDGAVVGNPATYAPLVVSEDHQSPQHEATGWKTEQEAYREVERSGAISTLVGQALTHHFQTVRL